MVAAGLFPRWLADLVREARSTVWSALLQARPWRRRRRLAPQIRRRPCRIWWGLDRGEQLCGGAWWGVPRRLREWEDDGDDGLACADGYGEAGFRGGASVLLEAEVGC
jgi:hypothetical protein